MRFLLCTGLIAGQVTMVTAAAGAGRAGRGSMDEELMSPAAFSVATSVAISPDGTSPSLASPPHILETSELGLEPRQKALFMSLNGHFLASTLPTIYDALEEWAFRGTNVFYQGEIAMWTAKFESDDVAKFITFLKQQRFSREDASFVLAFWFVTNQIRDDIFPCLRALLPVDPMDPMNYPVSAPASPRAPRVTVDSLPDATKGEADLARRLPRPRAQSF